MRYREGRRAGRAHRLERGVDGSVRARRGLRLRAGQLVGGKLRRSLALEKVQPDHVPAAYIAVLYIYIYCVCVCCILKGPAGSFARGRAEDRERGSVQKPSESGRARSVRTRISLAAIRGGWKGREGGEGGTGSERGTDRERRKDSE